MQWRVENLIRSGAGTREEYKETVRNVQKAIIRLGNRARNRRSIVILRDDDNNAYLKRRPKYIQEKWIIQKPGTPFYR